MGDPLRSRLADVPASAGRQLVLSAEDLLECRPGAIGLVGEVASPAKETPATAMTDRFRGRVLVAEDNEPIRRLVQLMLRRFGVRVAVASDGYAACCKAAASAARGRPYGIVFMDIQMPVMDGYEATGRLRKLGWKGPIVAMTAHAMQGDRQKCLDAGCDDYLAKPVALKDLQNVIARYLPAEVPASSQTDTEHPGGPPSAGLAPPPEMRQSFLDDVRKRAAAIESALEKGQLEALLDAVHVLAGGAAMFGCSEISSLARRLLERGRSGATIDDLRDDACELLRQCRAVAGGEDGGVT